METQAKPFKLEECGVQVRSEEEPGKKRTQYYWEYWRPMG